MKRLTSIVLLAVLLVLSACAPAARSSELPREARGPEVNAERQTATALADDYLRRVTDSAPLYASLDGCRDLRPRHSSYQWSCTVVRATAITGLNAATALHDQQARLAAEHCSAYPGLGITLQRLGEGLEPRFLYDVDYRCPQNLMVTIRFSTPTDPDLGAKLDLGMLLHGPGVGNVVSEQPVSDDVVKQLSGDTSQEIIMIVAVIRTYWLMPSESA